MDIKSLLIPGYLNEIAQQDAETEQTLANVQQMMSATRLNDSQSNRINALLPGELQSQGLEIQGQGIENQGKQIVNEGNQIVNQLNLLKQEEQKLNTKKLDMQIGYMDTDKELERNKIQAETALVKSQAGAMAAQTRATIATMNREDQAALSQAYPKAAATIKWVHELVGKGDYAGANTLYQSLLKSMPPKFLEFEGKQGVDLLGPEINEKDDPNTIRMFSEYLQQLVPQDSQMGTMQRQESANDATVRAAQIRADAAAIGDPGDAQKDRNAQLEAEAKVDKLVAPAIAQIVSTSKKSGSVVDRSGKIVDPVIASSVNTLTVLARESMARPGGANIAPVFAQHFELDKVDPSGIGKDNREFKVMMPKDPENRNKFNEIMNKTIAEQNLTPKAAYQQTFEAYAQKLTREIFGE